jgi:hypothetical protein
MDPVREAYVFNQCYSEEMASGLGITGEDTRRFAEIRRHHQAKAGAGSQT